MRKKTTKGADSDEESNMAEDSLLRSLMVHQSTRNTALQWEGRHQIGFQKSNEGWVKTLCMIRGRGLDYLVWPWSLCVLHALVYAFVNHRVEALEPSTTALGSWEVVFTFVLNSTLAFLLVFRLNRAAERYWISRKYWGEIVAYSRTMVSGLLIHAPHGPDRDEAIRWIGVFSLTTMEFLRGHGGNPDSKGKSIVDYPAKCFAGLLSPSEVKSLQRKHHPPMYSADRVRLYLKRLFPVDPEVASSPTVAIANSTRLDRLEEQLNSMVWRCGGMERIKSTPLPIVYVSHLRTFLFINLMLFPWVFGPTWGWSTVPIVAVSAFAWIGIDAASVEVESPFQQVRVNALNMNSYVEGLIMLIQEQLLQATEQDEVEL